MRQPLTKLYAGFLQNILYGIHPPWELKLILSYKGFNNLRAELPADKAARWVYKPYVLRYGSQL